jgi:hypothetical protein
MTIAQSRKAPLSALTAAAIAAVAITAIGQCAPAPDSATAATQRATLATFAGQWGGHTRRLTITRGGRASESIGSGCCNPVVDLRFRLSDPRGNRHVASVAMRVTWVRIRDPDAYSSAYPAPRVGQRARLRLRYGVITQPVTHTNYCNEKAQLKGTCGA